MRHRGIDRCVDTVAQALRTTAGPVTVALDEGGLRCAWARGGAAYVPFESISDATLRNSLFGTTLLVLTLAPSDEIAIKIANGNPFDVLGAVVAHLGESRPDRRVAHPHAFERGELDFSGWLDGVRRHACGREAYREAPVDRAALAALLDDEAASAALRAAAAHALMTIAGDDDLDAVAHALVNRALPPVVLVAVGVASGGSALVDDELIAEMTSLLPAHDRADVVAIAVAAGANGARCEPSACERVGVAKQRALDAARTEADANARAHAGGGGRRALHPVSTGAGNAGRWIGRSWGL